MIISYNLKKKTINVFKFLILIHISNKYVNFELFNNTMWIIWFVIVVNYKIRVFLPINVVPKRQ